MLRTAALVVIAIVLLARPDRARFHQPSPHRTAPWLEWIQRWERSIGEPVESFVRSDAYFDLMTQFNRARSQATSTFEGIWEHWLQGRIGGGALRLGGKRAHSHQCGKHACRAEAVVH